MTPTPMIPTRALLCHDMTRMERYDHETKLDGLLLDLNNRDTTPNDYREYWIVQTYQYIYSNMNVIDQTCNIKNIKKAIIQNNGILFCIFQLKQYNNMYSI